MSLATRLRAALRVTWCFFDLNCKDSRARIKNPAVRGSEAAGPEQRRGQYNVGSYLRKVILSTFFSDLVKFSDYPAGPGRWQARGISILAIFTRATSAEISFGGASGVEIKRTLMHFQIYFFG
jgi:hypothetical protein